IHSWANDGPTADRINAAVTTAIRHMMRPPGSLAEGRSQDRPLLAARRSASLAAALVAIHLVAVRARVVQLLADRDEGVEGPRLRRAARELADVDEIGDVLSPVGAIDGRRAAVLALASRRQQQ